MSLTVTRSDLKTFARQAVHSSATDDTATDRIERGIENALKMIAKDRKWSFLQETTDITTIAPYSTGSVSVSNAGTGVVGSGTTFPANSVGQFIEIAGERHWYEVTVRTDATNLTIRLPYLGTASGSTYRIVYAFYDLPVNFGWLNSLEDVTGDRPLDELTFNDNHWLHAARAGTGDPEAYALMTKRNDPNVKRLFFYPAPQSARLYQLVYYRYPGWFDTATPATSTWKRTATADTDYVDWPDDYMDLLHDAIRACVAKEIRPDDAARFMGEYRMNLAATANSERREGKPRLLGRPASGPRGNVWEF